MRLPRFTIRRLMILVAIASLLMGTQRLWGRRSFFLEQAETCDDRANDFAMGYVCLKDEYDTPGMYERLQAYWVAMARKYRHAARYPWLSVEPDPPPLK